MKYLREISWGWACWKDEAWAWWIDRSLDLCFMLVCVMLFKFITIDVRCNEHLWYLWWNKLQKYVYGGSDARKIRDCMNIDILNIIESDSIIVLKYCVMSGTDFSWIINDCAALVNSLNKMSQIQGCVDSHLWGVWFMGWCAQESLYTVGCYVVL